MRRGIMLAITGCALSDLLWAAMNLDAKSIDPFAGSGTTLQAAQAEGCRAIGVEREASYCEIITGRFHQRRLF